MSITRLSGGLTPGDGADPRTFPAIWNDTADLIEGLEVNDLADVDAPTPADGDTIVFDSASGKYVSGAAAVDGFVFKETIYYTSNGTFAKADYPWLRAIRVRTIGGGGGGGGRAHNRG
jgi:hypothetical protein